MQLEKSRETLSQTARDIFETMFFLSPEETAAPSDWAGVTGASVNFRGAREGRFELTVQQQLARELAAGFCGVGDPEEMSAEQVPQVLCELANMVCGATLSRMEPGALFDLDAPQVSKAVEENVECVQWLDSGQGLVRLALQWA